MGMRREKERRVEFFLGFGFPYINGYHNLENKLLNHVQPLSAALLVTMPYPRLLLH